MYYDGKTAPVEVNGDDALMLDGVRLLPTTVVNVLLYGIISEWHGSCIWFTN